MDPLEALFITIIAFGIGIIAAMLGIGGGILMVPILNLGFELPMKKATGTSLVVIIFTALSSSFAYFRQKRIHYKLGLIYATVTIPGAILGAIIGSMLEEAILQLVFGLFMMPIAAKMILRPKKRRHTENDNLIQLQDDILEQLPSISQQQYTFGLILGFIAGFASGLLGIGGGAVAVPTLALVIGLPMHFAVGTSAFVMIFTSIAGVSVKIWDKGVAWDFVPWMILGIVFGAQIGAKFARKIPAEQLQQIFGGLLIIVLVRMIIAGLGIF